MVRARSLQVFSVVGGSVLAFAFAIPACGQRESFQPIPEGVDSGTGFAEGGLGCSPNKGSYDIPNNNCDDDGDGKVDNPTSCDSAVSETGSADDFARAIGICDRASERGFGIVSATFTRGYERTDKPKDEQHGVLPKFGNVIVPREGSKLGVLSTGYAREYNGSIGSPFGGAVRTMDGLALYGVDWWEAGNGPVGTGTAPPGFPKSTTQCPQQKKTNDVVNLVLEIKAPPNAKGFKFDFNYFSGEWPAYVCSGFNDAFVAYLKAKGFNGGIADNVSFDNDKNPISVNNAFFDRCTPNMQTGCQGEVVKTATCPGGPSELAGTGFGVDGQWCAPFADGSTMTSTNGGATGWLTTSATVEPGETFTLQLMIFDTGDGILDSSILLDNFIWSDDSVVQTVRPPR